jgi:hypothetical protein
VLWGQRSTVHSNVSLTSLVYLAALQEHSELTPRVQYHLSADGVILPSVTTGPGKAG